MIDLSKYNFIQTKGPTWLWRWPLNLHSRLAGQFLIPNNKILIIVKENDLTKMSLTESLELGGLSLKDENYRTGKIGGYNIVLMTTYQTFWIPKHTLKVSYKNYDLF